MKKRFRNAALFGAFLIIIFGTLLCKVEVSMIGLDSGRLAMVEAIADQGVFHIENTHFKSVDKVVKDNHIYSDKPPMLSWCAAQFCKAVTFFTGRNFTNSYNFMIYLLALVFGAALNAVIFVWLFRYLCRTVKGNMRLKLLFAFLCCCGTWLFTYMTIFLNHVPSALAVTGVMISLDKYSRRKDIRAAAWAGVASGILFTLDFVAGAVFLFSSALSVWFSSEKETRFRATVRCALCGMIVVLFSAALNYYAYNTVIPLYIVSGGTFTPGTGGKDYFVYITETLFTCRGFFSHQPLFLLIFPAVYYLRKKLKANDICMLSSAAAVYVLYAVLTNEYGGGAYGFRYLVCIIPVVGYYTAKYVLTKRNTRLTVLAAALGAVGIFTSLVGAYEPLCVTFEGSKNPAGHFTENVRSCFLSNLLAMSYESDPDSFLTTQLINYYGKRDSFYYLRAQYIITKHFQTLEKLVNDPRFGLTKQAR